VLFLVWPIVGSGCADDILHDPPVTAGERARLELAGAAVFRALCQSALQVDRNIYQDSLSPVPVQLVIRRRAPL
jgi:hypothetical protein